jgi:hypothetical protein
MLLIKIPAEKAAEFIWKDQFSYAILRPLRDVDNFYYLPVTVLSQVEHSRWRTFLNQFPVVRSETVTITPVSYIASYDFRVNTYNQDNADDLALDIGSQHPEAWGYPAPNLFSMPAPRLYRFECRHNSDRPAGDRKGGRRRVELVQYNDSGTYYDSGDTVWSAWTTILTDQREGIDGFNAGLFHQWHQAPGTHVPPPPFAMAFSGGQLFIQTRSSLDSGPGGFVNHTHYLGDAPESWVPQNFVVAATWGEFGHLDVWLNGEKIVDTDTPIGYYAEGLPYLGYMKMGLYIDNTHTVDVLYHANIEFGMTDLSDRIENPLPLPPPGIDGWPGSPGPIVYPDTTVYPAHDVFPSPPTDVDVYPDTAIYPSLDVYPYISS